MPRQFDLIAFDWDGTLFDSTKIIVRCIQRAVADVGGAVPSDKAAAYVIGMGLMQALAHAAPDVPEEKYPELGARYRILNAMGLLLSSLDVAPPEQAMVKTQ